MRNDFLTQSVKSDGDSSLSLKLLPRLQMAPFR